MARYHDDDDEDHIDMRPLLRLTVWGACAVIGVGATVLAGRSDVGTARAKIALATLRTAPLDVVNHPDDLLATRAPGPSEDEQRLAEQVRTLTADRDRLAERVATLEHSVNDLTGSIARANAPAAPAAAPASPPPAPAEAKADAPPPAAPEPVTATAEPQVPPSNSSSSANSDDTRTAAPSPIMAAEPAPAQPGIGHPADVPLPRPGPLATIQSYVTSSRPPPAMPQTRIASANTETRAPRAGTSGYAIDLGSATSINTLRAHWKSVNAAHGSLFEGLQPLVSVRQSARPGFTDFHLIAGPVADADAAARLCAALTAARVPCRPSSFNGQRLDVR